MRTPITLKGTLAHPYFPFAFVVLLLFVLPRYLGSAAMIVACAVLLSAYLAAIPERLRSRSGSLAPAIWLVALMWIAAALILTLSLIGQIRG